MGTHDLEDCADGPPCVIHSPSTHHMATWPTHVRRDRQCMTERICAHGIGHPDPDSLAWIARGAPGLRNFFTGEQITPHPDDGTHGCDGCCWDPIETTAVEL